ncbi:MAG: hypothetical protein V3V08_07795 [Nannocystaceae bacterium]
MTLEPRNASRQAQLTRAFVGLFLSFLLSFHVVTAVHEVLGHGFLAWSTGATITDVYLGWAGGAGYVRWDAPPLLGDMRRLVAWGGIGVTFIFGAAAFCVNRRCRPARWGKLVWWTLAVCSWGSAFGYAVLGLHYKYGDPRRSAILLDEQGLLGVMVGALIMVQGALFFLASTELAGIAAAWWHTDSRRRRVALVLGLVLASSGSVALLNAVEAETTQRRKLALIQQSEAERGAQQWLDEELDRRRQFGEPEPTLAERTELLARRRRELKPWPLSWSLYFPGLFLASVAGLGCRTVLPRASISVPVLPWWLWVTSLGSIVVAGFVSAAWQAGPG